MSLLQSNGRQFGNVMVTVIVMMMIYISWRDSRIRSTIIVLLYLRQGQNMKPNAPTYILRSFTCVNQKVIILVIVYFKYSEENKKWERKLLVEAVGLTNFYYNN